MICTAGKYKVVFVLIMGDRFSNYIKLQRCEDIRRDEVVTVKLRSIDNQLNVCSLMPAEGVSIFTESS